jgi:cytochrome c peroxidase
MRHGTALSVSGKQSCATCHVESRAHAANDGLAVPLGGPGMDLPGFRNAPSLVYAQFTPAFSFQPDGTPVGGLFRDGRATSLAGQGEQPFVTPFEMASEVFQQPVKEVLRKPRGLPQVLSFPHVHPIRPSWNLGSGRFPGFRRR